MTACQRCWDDAWLRSRATPESQVEAYEYLIEVRDVTPAERHKCEAYSESRKDAMPDLTPTEARERLAAIVLDGVTIPASIGAKIRDAFLATTDALAVLLTWPALLEAGERVGKVKRDAYFNGRGVVPPLWGLTDPEAAP